MYKLYIKQKVFKLTDHYPIIDENEKEVYYVDQDFKFLGNTVHIQKIETGENIVVDREVLTLLPRYTVSFPDGKEIKINQNFTFLKVSIDLISDDYDLKLKGDFLGINYDIYNGDIVVGNIKKEWLSWGDTYVITVFKKEFEEELVALLIAVDEILDAAQSAT